MIRILCERLSAVLFLFAEIGFGFVVYKDVLVIVQRVYLIEYRYKYSSI